MEIIITLINWDVDSLNITRSKNLLLFLLIIFSSEIVPQNNIIALEGEPVTLKKWFIAPDADPQEKLALPSDEVWKPIQIILTDSKYTSGNWLIKTEVLILDSVDSDVVLGLFISNMLSAYEIYWDENLIARNGELGIDRTSEQPGKYLFHHALPKNITSAGKHTIIVRISNFRNDSLWKWYNSLIEISPYETGLAARYKSFFQPILFMGLLFIPFLFNIFLYFARNRKPEHLLFSVICFLVFLDSTTAAAPAFINLAATYIHFQYYVYNVITLLFSIMLPVFFVYFFSLPRKLILSIASLNIIVMVMSALFAEAKSIFNIMSIVLLIVSTIIVTWSVKEKKENSFVILFGVIVGWIAYFLNIAFTGLATIMVICVSFSIARQFAKSERGESEANLKSARLENELLKKNINPHFLLNTLTSVIAWLRKEPESAIKLVEALALEFRMINQISSLKTITMSQEVELCRTHLQIMNYRKKSNFALETFGLIEDEQIPPMIFHTLIENGLTHGYENKSEGVFTLKRTESENAIQFCLSNDGEYNENEHPQSSGVGFNYIKGRLEESFSGKWNLSSHQIDNGWETVIDIRSK